LLQARTHDTQAGLTLPRVSVVCQLDDGHQVVARRHIVENQQVVGLHVLRDPIVMGVSTTHERPTRRRAARCVPSPDARCCTCAGSAAPAAADPPPACRGERAMCAQTRTPPSSHANPPALPRPGRAAAARHSRASPPQSRDHFCRRGWRGSWPPVWAAARGRPSRPRQTLAHRGCAPPHSTAWPAAHGLGGEGGGGTGARALNRGRCKRLGGCTGMWGAAWRWAHTREGRLEGVAAGPNAAGVGGGGG
jgi:hypothetical protein